MKYLRKLNIRLVKGKYRNPIKGQVSDPKQIYEVFKAIKDHAQETLLGVPSRSGLRLRSTPYLSQGVH